MANLQRPGDRESSSADAPRTNGRGGSAGGSQRADARYLAGMHRESEAQRLNGMGMRPMRGPFSGDLADPRLDVAAGSRGFRTVLRNRYFLRLWVAQLISQTIMNASNYGLIVLVASIGNNVTYTSFAIIAFSLPPALFGAPAGVLVDRLNRRTVLWISNVLRAVAAGGFVLSLFVDQHALIPVLILSFITALIGQFFAPAEGATIPLLVHPDELMNALALFNITFTLAQLLGLIILGPAIVLFVPTVHIGPQRFGVDLRSIESLFLIAGVFYLVCALLILSIPRAKFHFQRRTHPARRREEGQWRGIWTGIVEAWHFMRRDRVLLNAVFQLCLGGTVVAIVATIAPQFVSVFFHRPKEYAALVLGPAGVGLVVGSALTPLIVRRLHYVRTIALGIVLLAVCAVLLTLAQAIAASPRVHDAAWWDWPPYLAVALALIFLVGIALDLINVPAQTLMQEHSPDWIKGRVLALQGMLLNTLTVPSVLAMGLVADTLGLGPAMDILAVAIALVGLGSLYFGARNGFGGHGKRDVRLVH
ncbi:MAG TPA: MFS transporter [Ktedonobacterales bacterium]|nr:MFS transporter [Ktedonobacterales bacterium]